MTKLKRIIALMLLLALSAHGLSAQGKLSSKVNVSLTNATLSDVMWSLESQAGIKFIVKSDDASSVKVGSVQMQGATVKEVLDKTLKGTGLDYMLVDGIITIVKKGDKPAPGATSGQTADTAGQDREAPSTASMQGAPTDQAAKKPSNKKITVKGHVQDVGGLALVGATVVEQGSTKNNTLTNSSGDFTLTLPANSAIEVMFFGMESQVIPVAGRQSINITLKDAVVQIQEVVVTGYGSVAKEAYTGSAVMVTSKELEDRPLASIEEAFRGNVVGALSNASGQPGEPGQVILRGFGSIDGNNQPLYVVDGVAWDMENVSGSDNISSNPLAALNPSDIESMTVLKDAASASLYGSRGANGVVVITTKKGKLGEKIRIDVNQSNGFSIMTDAPLMVNGREYAELWTEGQMNRNIYNLAGSEGGNQYDRTIEILKMLYADKGGATYGGKNYYEWKKEAQTQFNTKYMMPTPNGGYLNYDYFGDDYNKLPNTNWFDEITRVAPFNKTSVAIRGGFQTVNYYTSMEYYNQQGTVWNSQLERYTLRMRLNQEAPSRFFSWGINSYIAYANQTGPQVGGGLYAAPTYAAHVLPAVVPVRLGDGSYNFAFPDNLLNGTHNPLANAYENINERPQVSITVTADFKFRFNDWLSLTSRNSVYYYNFRRRMYSNTDFGEGLKVGGALTERDVHRSKLVSTNMLNAHKQWRNGHNVTAVAGYEIEDLSYHYVSVSGQGFESNEVPYLSNAGSIRSFSGTGYDYALHSFVSKADYSYKGKYLAGASYRMDWSSRFGPDYRCGKFWSLSAGYDMAKEKFMLRHRRTISQLKWKGSYGINGNQPSQYYYWQELYTSVRYGSEHGVYSDYRERPELTWEGNRIWNVGFDGSFFRKKLDLGMEIYQRKSSNLLEWRKVSLASGYPEMLMNTDAGIDNRGIEINGKWNILNRKGWVWDLNFNLAKFSSKYYGLSQQYLDGSSRQLYANGVNVHTWYIKETAGIDPDSGRILYVNYDSDGNRYISTSSSESPYRTDWQGVPKVTGGFTNVLTWKRFELNALCTFGLGHYIFSTTGMSDGSNVTNAIAKCQLDRWNPDNTDATSPLRLNNRSSNTIISRFLYKGDYLKIKSLKFRYRVHPHIYKKLGMDFAAISIQAENLYHFSALKDYDPETSVSGYRKSDRYPTSSTYTMSLYVRF